MTATLNVQPLRLLAGRFAANVAALATRDPSLAAALTEFVSPVRHGMVVTADKLTIGRMLPGGFQPLPTVVTPATAALTVRSLYPTGFCDKSALIVGEDLGWLWNAAYRLPCKAPMFPNHRPPLYFLVGDVQTLWLMLHVQDWVDLLADSRVVLYAGPDCVERFRAGLVEKTMLPWPLLSVIVDGSIWPNALTIDAVRAEAQRGANDRLQTIKHMQTLVEVATRSDEKRPLRILGVCSQYTTFLKYSMRDWLAGFARLGHETKFLIESADHEICNSLALAEMCLDFQPDVVVSIDHYRAELAAVPEHIPVVMWVQDYLPNIFSTSAGRAQGDNDYVVGFAGLKLIHEYGYPAARFVPAMVGVDEVRFTNARCDARESAALQCEASFVSHASATAESMLQDEIQRLGTPAAARLLGGVYEQLRDIYRAGGAVVEPVVIDRLIDATMASSQTFIEPEHAGKLATFFTQKINNALFRHQSLQWLSDAGVNLHLYGNGWENHPTLARHARGPAEHGEQLRRIYQSSKINLQITPHGALHQRLFEGFASGGFFLIRKVPGDLLERHLLKIALWCDRFNIRTDLELRTRATPEIRQHLATVADSLQVDPFGMACPLIETVQWSQSTGCIRSAGSVWGDDYDAAAFDNQQQLLDKTRYFLNDASARQAIADRMRAEVVRRFTYTATSRRLLNLIASDHGAARFASAA